MEENEILEAEVEEVDAEVVDEAAPNNGFDPNAVLNSIMGNQNAVLRNYVLKLSTLSTASKAMVVLLLFPYLNFGGVALLVYNLYSIYFLLTNYKNVRDYEGNIKDALSKGDNRIDIKKVVKKFLILNLVCIPLAVLSIWYWIIFRKN